MYCSRCSRPIQGNPFLVKFGRPLTGKGEQIPLACWAGGREHCPNKKEEVEEHQREEVYYQARQMLR